jgi:hypothetical protein
MPVRRHGAALGIVAFAVVTVAVFAGTMGRAAADQTGAGAAFGPGHCGPIDPSTVWADVPADGTPVSPEIVVTAESPTDPAAANSAIIQATLDLVR